MRFALTQQDLAGLLGVSASTVHYYEKKGAPRWVRLALIGLAELHFDVPRTELGWLGRKDPADRVVRPLRVAEPPPAPDPDEE